MCQNCRIVTLARKLVAESDAYDEATESADVDGIWRHRAKQNEAIKLLEQEFKTKEILNVD
jgi:hypothetical protein